MKTQGKGNKLFDFMFFVKTDMIIYKGHNCFVALSFDVSESKQKL